MCEVQLLFIALSISLLSIHHLALPPMHAICYTQSQQAQVERGLTLKYSREEDEMRHNRNARKKASKHDRKANLMTTPCMLRPSREKKKMRDLKAKPL